MKLITAQFVVWEQMVTLWLSAGNLKYSHLIFAVYTRKPFSS